MTQDNASNSTRSPSLQPSALHGRGSARAGRSWLFTSGLALGVAVLGVSSCSDDDEPASPGAGGQQMSSGGAAGGTQGDAGAAGDSAAGAGATNGGGGAGGVAEGTGGMPLDNGQAGTPQGAAGAAMGVDAGAMPVAAGLPAPNCEAAAQPQVPNLQLTPFVSGFSRPLLLLPEPLALDATQPPEQERFFVLEQGGTVQMVVNGQVQAQTFLDIEDRVQDQGNEQGLLGMAFHPDFQNNGRFYLNYSALGGGDTVVSEFVATFTDSVVSPTVDASTERVLLTIEQPQGNHNGGNIVFGPDGYLYIGMGDGGGANDANHGPVGNGQNLDALLGKILRIDVNVPEGANDPYAIPADNPFVNAEGADEIWSAGIRNPWRFTFDACTGDMYLGDVGQNELEEIDFEPAGQGGRNYGWRCEEGDQVTNLACDGIDTSNFIDPVAVQGRNVAQSITGGYVYRGSAIPELRGTYLYADYVSAEFFTLRMANGQLVDGSTQTITNNINSGGVPFISSFGEDLSGELYVVSFDGTVYRVEAGN